ncbi:unnamed protein product [Closterium sp. Naga37s-1]|nr:unnamed protein product [Closterium sp. Naga37s-1]
MADEGFDARKAAVLAALASVERDKSLKGGLDAPIADLVAEINGHDDLFTTSSCSGRISLLLEPHDAAAAAAAAAGAEREGGGEGLAADSAGAAKRVKKKARGGEWFLVSHDPIDPADLVTAVFSTSTARTDTDVSNSASSISTPATPANPAIRASPRALPGELVFRFEPLILALECRSLTAAQALVSCAIRAGFRESGITSVSPKRIIAAVRCSIRLEAPLTAGGVPLVGEAYVRQLAAVANGKMALNRERTERFRARFKEECSCSLLSHPPPQPSQPEPTPLHPAHSPVPTPEPSHPRKAARRSSKGQQEAANGHVAQQKDCQLSPRQLAQRQVAVLRRVGEVERRVVELLKGRAVEQGECASLTVCEAASAGVPIPASFLAAAAAETAEVSVEAAAGAGMAPLPLQDVAGGCCSSAWDLPTKSQESKKLAHGRKERDGQLHGQVVKVLGLPEGSLLRWGHSAVMVAASRAVVGTVGAEGTAGKEIAGAGATNAASTVAGTSEAEKARGEAAGTAVVVFGGFGGSGVHGRRGDVVVVRVRGREEEGGRRSEGEREGEVVVEGSVVETRGSGPSPRMWHSATVVRVGRGRGVVRGKGVQRRSVAEVKGADSSEPRERGEEEEEEEGEEGEEEEEGEEGEKEEEGEREEEMVVIGGRHGPTAALADVFSLNLRTMTWRCVAAPEALSGEDKAATAVSATAPATTVASESTAATAASDATAATAATGATGVPVARYRHAAAALGSSVFVFGGTSHPHAPPLTSLQVFSARSFSWLPDPVVSGQMPAPRHSHAMATVGNRVYLFGGRDTQRVFSDLFFFEVVGSDSAVGECPEIVLVNTASNEVSGIPVALPPGALPVRHTASLVRGGSVAGRAAVEGSTVGDRLLVLGGGAACFAFGSAPVAPTLTRDSRLQLLLGSSSWVEHRENGITYTFDAGKCMFSSGNGTEKQRMAALKLHDREVVVDLFAGIGYFTIPLLVHARARHVFACEWNPPAVHGLRSSLAANQVSPDRYTVLEGDNRVVAPVGVANRVLLGLIPSSEASWRTAIRCLKPREGGVAHVHGNVVDVEEQQWTDYVVGEFEKLAREEGRSWEVKAVHLERVKWYAPHIRHVVLDVCCKPNLVDGAE